MEIRPLKTEKDYEKALQRIEEIFDASVDSKEGDEAEILSMLIENYEDEFYTIDAPDPIEAIKIRMDEMDLKQKDLVAYIGAKSKVSEVLNRKRRLTLEMIRKLSDPLKLSASLLIKDYQLMP
jgi:HTH-type transcriptional regulator/antitoxin HigA